MERVPEGPKKLNVFAQIGPELPEIATSGDAAVAAQLLPASG
jgi:hypothetical protein